MLQSTSYTVLALLFSWVKGCSWPSASCSVPSPFSLQRFSRVLFSWFCRAVSACACVTLLTWESSQITCQNSRHTSSLYIGVVFLQQDLPHKSINLRIQRKLDQSLWGKYQTWWSCPCACHKGVWVNGRVASHILHLGTRWEGSSCTSLGKGPW